MKALIVVNRENDWPHQIPGAAVATAKSYLTGPAANSDQYRQVVNLCRCARTDDAGFYVSLLAEARGQRPLPSAKALEELRGSPANAGAVREIDQRVKVEPFVARLHRDLWIEGLIEKRRTLAVARECIGGPFAGRRKVELMVAALTVGAHEHLAAGAPPELPADPGRRRRRNVHPGDLAMERIVQRQLPIGRARRLRGERARYAAR